MPRRRKQLVEIKNWLSHPRYKWLAVYRQGGKAQRRYFKSEKLAKTFAAEKVVELLNEGALHAPISERERRAIYVARENDVDVAEAIDEAIARHAANKRSVSLELAAEQLLERREAEGKSTAHHSSTSLAGQSLKSNVMPSTLATLMTTHIQLDGSSAFHRGALHTIACLLAKVDFVNGAFAICRDDAASVLGCFDFQGRNEDRQSSQAAKQKVEAFRIAAESLSGFLREDSPPGRVRKALRRLPFTTA